MNSKNLLVDTTRLCLLIEARQDSLGKTSYVVTTSLGKMRFRNLASVLDFIEMNHDLGYVK